MLLSGLHATVSKFLGVNFVVLPLIIVTIRCYGFLIFDYYSLLGYLLLSFYRIYVCFTLDRHFVYLLVVVYYLMKFF